MSAKRDGTMEPRLLTYYQDKVRPKLKEDLGLGNVHQVPKVEKVVVNVGVGEGSRNQKLLDSVVEELLVITGQKPVVRKARKSNRELLPPGRGASRGLGHPSAAPDV